MQRPAAVRRKQYRLLANQRQHQQQQQQQQVTHACACKAAKPALLTVVKQPLNPMPQQSCLFRALQAAPPAGDLAKQMAALTEQMRKLATSSRRIISEEALDMLKSSVFLILKTSESGMSTSSSSEAGISIDASSSIDGNRYAGVGVCVGAREAVTAAHNLEGFEISDPVQVFFPLSKQKLQLLVMDKDTKLDYAVLAAAAESTHFSTHLPLYRGSSVSLVGQQLAMCAFQLGVHDELPEWSPSSLGVMPATGVKLSKHEHHLFYTSDTWPGDSGGALVMYDGELVGLHVSGVNALKDRCERMRSVEDRLTAVEESLESAARSVASGCVALLVSVFAKKIDV